MENFFTTENEGSNVLGLVIFFSFVEDAPNISVFCVFLNKGFQDHCGEDVFLLF